ncbi:MAG TPA: TolC family protein [Planctomycetota bacterium]|jgi:outer membrane protein TolC
MKRTLMAVLAGLGLAAAARADGGSPPGPAEIRLSLRECVHLALNHNLDIEISRYQPWIDDQGLRAAFGSFDHVLYADGSTGRTRAGAKDFFAGAPTLSAEDSTFRTGLRRTLPAGVMYDLSLSVEREHSNSTFVLLDPIWQSSLGLSLTVPVLRGAGEEANATAIVLARNTRRLSVAQFEKLLTDTVFSVQEAYWALVAAIEQKRFRDQALEVAKKLLEDNRRRFEGGTLAKVDVTEAEAGVASQIEGILTAENDVQDAMDRLKRLADPGLLREDSRIIPLDGPREAAQDLDERSAVETGLRDAMDRRPEYRGLFVEIDSQDRTVSRARNDSLPRLNAVASGSLLGLEDDFSGSGRELKSGDTYSWTAGVVLEIPLENRSADGALRRAELERRRLILRRRNLEDQILVEVREAVRAIKTAERRIEATRQARVLAREQFDGEMSRREAGLRTTFHVLDARSKLTDAETREVRSRVDYAAAWAGYRRAAGTLLSEYGILVEPNLVPRQSVR